MMGEDIEFDSVQEFIDGAKSGRKPFEKTFHRKPNLSFGVQVFKPNADYTHKGNQPVHEFDELYYIVEAGKDEEAGKLQVDGKDYCVKPGSLYFIPKKVPHKFYDNKKDIVFFYIFGGEDEVFYPHIE
jgi:mannose-6-phosphate isomerase-like protein (cupin superfamily)